MPREHLQHLTMFGVTGNFCTGCTSSGDRSKRLKEIMVQYRLRRQDVCRFLGMKVHARSLSNSTLDDWLSGRTEIPYAKLECLRLKLREIT